MSFTAKDVMNLRQKTGLGMMDCKKALAEKDGDPEAAEQWLRETKKGKMDSRTERTTGEGRIEIALGDESAAIIEVRTETDFTARNDSFVEAVEKIAAIALQSNDGEIKAADEIAAIIDDLRITTGENANYGRGFKYSGGTYGHYIHHDGKRACLLQFDNKVDEELAKGVCQHIVFHDPMGISADDVSPEQIEQIRLDAIQEAKDTGKNDEIAQKMADGKVRKHLQENTLLAQKYVLDESKTIQEILPDEVNIKAFTRYTLGG
ncbi:MAG: translation elongation factor Ts [Planctomycetota bacterium]|nr:translation elongation factor Ts [Planctomycetota bacterium]